MSGYIYGAEDARESARLAALAAGLDPGTTRLLDTEIGVGAGWRCLEVGAGGGSIARWLCDRVGDSGRVVATDLDVRHLDPADSPQLEIRRHDIVHDALEEAAYDLVHARAVLEHLPERRAVLEKLVAALAPGGWILVEDVDFQFALQTSEDEVAVAPASEAAAWARLMSALREVTLQAGIDGEYGRRLPGELMDLGLERVGAESRARLFVAGSAEASTAALTLARLRETLVATGLVTADDVDRAARWFDTPGFAKMSPPQVAAWGRRPSA